MRRSTAARPRQPVSEPTWAHGASGGGGVPEHVTPQGGGATTGNSPSGDTGSSAPGSGNSGTGNSNGGTGSGSTGGSSASLAELTSLLPTGSLPTSALPTSALPLDQLSASSVDKTLNHLVPGVPGNVSTGVAKAKSTVSGLLNEVAGLL